MSSNNLSNKFCANPFKKDNHRKNKGLRYLTTQQHLMFPNIPQSARICSGCRKDFSQFKHTFPSNEELENTTEISQNELLETNSLSKVDSCTNISCKAGLEVIEQINEKIKNTSDKAQIISLLTLAPKSWGRRMLAREFGVSERQARRAIMLVAENGILSSPNPKPGKKCH